MCRKLAPIELTITAGFLNLAAASPTITEEEKPIVAEMQQLVKDLRANWETPKAQRLWSLSASKVLVEEEKFMKESNGARCAIGWVLKMANEEAEAKMAADLAALLAAKSAAPVVAPNVPTNNGVVADTTTTTTEQTVQMCIQ